MNHSLAIYTALFFSIIFLTVSIFSGDIQSARGESLALLILQAVFCLKLAIDDYVHFQRLASDPLGTETRDERNKQIEKSLWFSLVMYLLLAASIGSAAKSLVQVSEVLFAAMMAAGLIWLFNSKPSPNDHNAPGRRKAWMFINGLFVVLLLCDVFFLSAPMGDCSIWLISFLILMVLLDAIFLGTIRRLAALN